MKTFELKLISPEGLKYETEATSISLPTQDGQITILPDHEPIVTLLCPGEIILQINGKEHLLATEGGIAEIAHNKIKILADTAEDLESLDRLKIEEAEKNAKKLLAEAKNEVEYADALAQLEKQLSKINILKRRKKYR